MTPALNGSLEKLLHTLLMKPTASVGRKHLLVVIRADVRRLHYLIVSLMLTIQLLHPPPARLPAHIGSQPMMATLNSSHRRQDLFIKR